MAWDSLAPWVYVQLTFSTDLMRSNRPEFSCSTNDPDCQHSAPKCDGRLGLEQTRDHKHRYNTEIQPWMDLAHCTSVICCTPAPPPAALRSADKLLLTGPKAQLKLTGERMLTAAARKLCNNLPLHIRETSSCSNFKNPPLPFFFFGTIYGVGFCLVLFV